MPSQDLVQQNAINKPSQAKSENDGRAEQWAENGAVIRYSRLRGPVALDVLWWFLAMFRKESSVERGLKKPPNGHALENSVPITYAQQDAFPSLRPGISRDPFIVLFDAVGR